jgi:hypothetical protein
MKRVVVLCSILLNYYGLIAQDKKLPDYSGQYQVDYYPSRKMNVFSNNNKLILEIVGLGKIELIPQGENTFSAKEIPNLKIIFVQDSLGNTVKFKWVRQQAPYELYKTSDAGSQSVSDSSGSNLASYEGRYSAKGTVYFSIQIKSDSGRLIVGIPGETSLIYYPVDKSIFIYKKNDFSSVYEFLSNKKGHINRIKVTEKGPFECSKISGSTANMASVKHSFTQRTRFTAADSLQGSLSPLRSCYDVLFYGLDVKVNPDTKFILGSTIIRFKSVQDFSLFQIDLFANMKIEKIVFHGSNLNYSRKLDAVFVQFPVTIMQGSVEEIVIFYSGNPQVPDIPNLAGGFIWTLDRNGKAWIETVVQGSGASLWWPCKDHLSDKPDSMRISVTVPDGLTAVSNGRFLGKMDLPEKLVKFQWAVSYPINTYDAVLYVGDYVHFSDQYVEGTNRFPLNYYCLSYNLDMARQFVQKVKPLLAFYQNEFGPYPFPLDGYALVESPYPMEHQSAVSIGVFSNPFNKNPMDTVEMERMLFHESAHEWWGNSVTCSDYADFWIHESFASYAEVLSYENFYGPEAARKYLLKQIPENKEPIIGFYGVNDFHEGDMYPKGAHMIATLRNAINNDSLFFSLLKGIQSHFKYQSVTTSDIINYFNQGTGTDYTWLFDQYLRHAAIPKLVINMKKSGNDLEVRYKWNADITDFKLPVKVSTGSTEQLFIYPTTEWKTIRFTNSKPRDLHVDNTYSYFDIDIEKSE